ncbi:MAG: hypothetical protein ACYTAS_16015, partial [Planctomycetota bacterium]
FPHIGGDHIGRLCLVGVLNRNSAFLRARLFVRLTDGENLDERHEAAHHAAGRPVEFVGP